uniref:Uncharacterized protein n=1 Tax=Romanomermis culicivorax TaxID=13658 RepID=A0A915HM43_ROMCU
MKSYSNQMMQTTLKHVEKLQLDNEHGLITISPDLQESRIPEIQLR